MNCQKYLYNEIDAAVYTVKCVLHRSGLRGFCARRKPLLQKQCLQASLKFSSDLEESFSTMPSNKFAGKKWNHWTLRKPLLLSSLVAVVFCCQWNLCLAKSKRDNADGGLALNSSRHPKIISCSLRQVRSWVFRTVTLNLIKSGDEMAKFGK